MFENNLYFCKAPEDNDPAFMRNDVLGCLLLQDFQVQNYNALHLMIEDIKYVAIDRKIGKVADLVPGNPSISAIFALCKLHNHPDVLYVLLDNEQHFQELREDQEVQYLVLVWTTPIPKMYGG